LRENYIEEFHMKETPLFHGYFEKFSVCYKPDPSHPPLLYEKALPRARGGFGRERFGPT
jgi:hypothetical protein